VLGGTDSGLFNIDAASDALTFKGAPNFEAPADALAKNVYDITVTASDGVLGFPARKVAITVTDVFDVILGIQGPHTLNGTAQNDTLQGLGRYDQLNVAAPTPPETAPSAPAASSPPAAARPGSPRRYRAPAA